MANIKESEFYEQKKILEITKYRNLSKQLPAFVKSYLDTKELNIKYSSLIAYTYDIIVFLEYIKNVNPAFKDKTILDIQIDDISNLTEEDIIEYKKYLNYTLVGTETIKNNEKAIARKLIAIRGLFKYFLRKGYVSKNITEAVAIPKGNKRNMIVRLDASPQNNELQTFLDGINNITTMNITKRQKAFLQKTWLRDKALLYLLTGTGIRVSECQGLDIDNLDMELKTITIKRKGGFYSKVWFNDTVKGQLEDYLGEREEFLKKHINISDVDKKALFLSSKGKRLSVDAIEDIVAKYTKIIFAGRTLSPHKLRSTYGSLLYQKTGDIRLTADVLDHSNINITAKYYAAQTEENKKKAGEILF